MADFSTDPALAIQAPQPANVLDMAGKAATLHGQLLQNTGMGLDQHFQRLGTVFRAGMSLLNPDGTADPAAVKAMITDGVAQNNLTPSDGATLLTNVPGDPKQAGQWLRQGLAGVGNALEAITPHMGYQDTGAGVMPVQSNALARGGASMPPITRGLSASELAAPKEWDDATGAHHVGTMGEYLQSQGVNTSPQVGGMTDFGPNAQKGVQPIAAPEHIAQQPIAQSGQQIAATTMNVLNGGNPLTGAPGAGGKGIVIQPGTVEPRTQNIGFRNKDIAEGTDPNIGVAIGNLQGIVSAADSAITGAGSSWRSSFEKSLNLAGIDTKGATDRDIMDKEQMLLVQQLGATGSATDAAMAQQFHTTPGGSMTPEAIKTTAALTLGLLKYKMALAAVASGATDPNTYNQVRSDFIAKNPTPLMYAMPSMPKAQQAQIWKYVDKLPDAEQADFVTKFQQVK